MNICSDFNMRYYNIWKVVHMFIYRENDFEIWTFYELYELFVNFNKRVLTNWHKKYIIYNRKGNWADTVDLSIECKNKKNIALFCNNKCTKLKSKTKKKFKKFKKKLFLLLTNLKVCDIIYM